MGLLSKGLRRLSTKQASTEDEGLDWEDTYIVEILEGPQIGGPGKYRLSQTAYMNSGLTQEEKNQKLKDEEAKALKERKELEMMGMRLISSSYFNIDHDD